MLARKLVQKFRSKNQTDHPAKTGFDRSGLVLPVAGIILLAAGIMQLLGTPERHVTIPMLAQADGLFELDEPSLASQYTNIPLTLPTQIFGAELSVIGVYTTSNEHLPTQTIALVYIRDGWRYVEIDYKPLSIEEQLAIASGRQDTTVTLSEEVEGIFFSRNSLGQCVGEGTDAYPGKCEIDRQLFFPLNEIVIALSGTSTQITDGEMIEIARSILEQGE